MCAVPETRRKTNIWSHEDEIHDAGFSRGGKYVATASHDQTARVWDVATGKGVTICLAAGVYYSFLRSALSRSF
jgi:WD40 repeat protein